MGLLTPEKLDELIAAGCSACGGKKLIFQTYVDGRLPLMDGEPVGRLAWAYDGEAFCDGVYEVKCAKCAARVFSSSACPRCHKDGGLAEALAAENAFPVPKGCPRCEREEISYFAMVPATTAYEGKRAEKARTSTEILDPGFHGYKAACKTCGVFAELRDRCPLCDAPGPLRPRA
jgi:hypothetical protein